MNKDNGLRITDYGRFYLINANIYPNLDAIMHALSLVLASGMWTAIGCTKTKTKTYSRAVGLKQPIVAVKATACR